MSRNLIIVLVVLVLLVAGFFLFRNTGTAPAPAQTSPTPVVSEQETTTPTQEVQGATIKILATGFDPKTITIKTGETVRWENKSGKDVSINSAPHPAHTDYLPLNLGVVADGGTASLRFDKAGTYRYHNHFNPSQSGSIEVQ